MSSSRRAPDDTVLSCRPPGAPCDVLGELCFFPGGCVVREGLGAAAATWMTPRGCFPEVDAGPRPLDGSIGER
jgi:hypothetical protein